ncbi:hypothetical protein C1G86_0873 [Dehalococcoides mccartyi]|uniref:Uncharacterized protein n=1 Tax=Dehalococcoides mccartyi TaxID=61435 RepID=A0A328EPE1_9CHLR|nr:hypothetical protein C1G86_0873 [Dehalococcoides mccartyi]
MDLPASPITNTPLIPAFFSLAIIFSASGRLTAGISRKLHNTLPSPSGYL